MSSLISRVRPEDASTAPAEEDPSPRPERQRSTEQDGATRLFATPCQTHTIHIVAIYRDQEPLSRRRRSCRWREQQRRYKRVEVHAIGGMSARRTPVRPRETGGGGEARVGSSGTGRQWQCVESAPQFSSTAARGARRMQLRVVARAGATPRPRDACPQRSSLFCTTRRKTMRTRSAAVRKQQRRSPPTASRHAAQGEGIYASIPKPHRRRSAASAARHCHAACTFPNAFCQPSRPEMADDGPRRAPQRRTCGECIARRRRRCKRLYAAVQKVPRRTERREKRGRRATQRPRCSKRRK